MGSKKTKTKTEPWAPAQPYILKGMEQTDKVFDDNQPRLADMSNLAYQGASQLAPTALAPSAFVNNAQATAQAISNGFFLGNNPGQRTYDRLQGAGLAQRPSFGVTSAMVGKPLDRRFNGVSSGVSSGDPSMGLLREMARSNSVASALGGDNPATGFASGVAGGQYLNAQPSAGLYGTMMSNDYLKGNPYLDGVIARTNADVAKDANRMFGARGMGSGISSAFADMVSKNLANNEGQLRYQNYNDASNRQLQAAGQSDAAFSAERGRMDSATGLLSSDFNAAQGRALQAAQADAQNRLAAAQALGGQYNAGADRNLLATNTAQDRALAATNAAQGRALEAAKAGDAARSDQVSQMLQALGLTGSLRDAEYAGVAPTLNLLNTAAEVPYIGVGALNGNIRQASNGYGTVTQKTSGGLGGVLGEVAGAAAKSFGGSLGTGLFNKIPGFQ